MPLRNTRPRSPHLDATVPAAIGLCLLLFVACAPVITGRTEAGVMGAHDAGVAHDEPVSQRLSPACSATAAREIPERLAVRGRERLVLSHVPERADAAPRDLVIAFHGRTNDAARARRYFRLDGALPEAVIAYPQALPAGPGAFAWSDPGDPPDAQRDFDLVEAIVDAFGRARCIDLERVFVVGHSLGAYFANDVACSLATRVRAVASVAGGLRGSPCISRTAALLIHHADDALVPLSAGEHARDAFLVASGLADATATPAAHPALAALRCVRYGDGVAPDPVVWCAHDEATWPSGRYDPHTWPAATPAAIAEFFRRLP